MGVATPLTSTDVEASPTVNRTATSRVRAVSTITPV
jgi:hypothetical protein